MPGRAGAQKCMRCGVGAEGWLLEAVAAMKSEDGSPRFAASR